MPGFDPTHWPDFGTGFQLGNIRILDSRPS